MFALIKFVGGGFYITQHKFVKILKNDDCLVKYKGGTKYSAKLIRIHASKNNLQSILKQLTEKAEPDNVGLKDKKNSVHQNIKSNTERLAGSGITTSGPSVNIRHLVVPKSNSSKNKTTKKDFCIFCKKLVTQFARHLQLGEHKKEQEVQLFMKYPKQSLTRKRLINKLRKQGNFEHNTNPEYNSGILITCRRKQSNSHNLAEDYKACTKCKGSFSKRTIRIHFAKCNVNHNKSVGEVNTLGKQISHYVPPTNITSEHLAIPEDESIEVFQNSNIHKPDTNTNRKDSVHQNTKSNTERLAGSGIITSGPSVNMSHLVVPKSNSSKNKTTKKDFCIFCKKLVTQFARHLQLGEHKKEREVQLFMKYPKKSLTRKRLINKLRKQGNFEHNTNPEYNSGILITCRRKQSNSHNLAEDYKACTKCKGSFSKRTIRIHFAKCNVNHNKSVREVNTLGKQISHYVPPTNITSEHLAIPEDESIEIFQNSNIHKPDTNTNKKDSVHQNIKSNTERLAGSGITTSGPSVNIRHLVVPKSNSSINKTTKKDFCIFCKKLVTQFARHLQSGEHKKEQEVQLFMKYPKQSLTRKRLINKLRKQGNFEHNTNPEYNSGILITCRRKQSNSHNLAEDYKACTKCKGSFSKRTIRIHYAKCNVNHNKGVGEVNTLGKQISHYVPPTNITSEHLAIPEDESIEVFQNSNIHKPDTNTNKKDSVHQNIKSSTERLAGSGITTSGPSVNIRHLVVPKSNSSINKTTKKDFCIFCKKLVTQFARHLQLGEHKKEREVQLFMKYPKKSLTRKRLINKLRKQGNFEHNTNPEYNSGILITCRRKQSNSHNLAEDYKACTKCKGSFSKRTIRIHYAKCNVNHNKGIRDASSTLGKQISHYVHIKASDMLKRIITTMHDDDITRSIKSDELIIIAGNKFCDTYTLDQQDEKIRNHLRLLGQLKIAVIAKCTDINEFACIFHPKYYDLVADCVREIARYDPHKRVYGERSKATTLSNLIQKCSLMLMAECTKNNDMEKKEDVTNFLILYENGFFK